jgi:hypothetical protein
MTDLAPDVALVARLNIEHYREMLAEETDETNRQSLLDLVAKEAGRLSHVVGAFALRKRNG